MNTIQEFNNNLANTLTKCELNEYFNDIHSKFYNNIDISFMEYFLSLVNKNGEFCVDHMKLKEYGVLNNIDKSKDIKRRLTTLDLTENEDYILLGNVPQNPNGGRPAKEYTLTPKAFKLCLIRAKNSKKYAKYQNLYKEKILTMKDDKIDTLTKKVDELLGYAKDTNEKLDETKHQLEDVQIQLDDARDERDEIHDKIEDIKDIFKEVSNRSVPNPENMLKRSEFILLQSKTNDNEFTFIRGIQYYNGPRVNKKYADEYNIIKREYNANPIQLYNSLKENVKAEYKAEKIRIRANKKLKNKRVLYRNLEKIKFKSNTISIERMTLNELLDRIESIANTKFVDYNFITAP